MKLQAILLSVLLTATMVHAQQVENASEVIRSLIQDLDDGNLQQKAIEALKDIQKNGFRSDEKSPSLSTEISASLEELLIMTRQSLVFPEDPNDDPVKWKRWGEWYLLNDEKVNVRIYSNWQEDPAEYTMTKVGIKNHTVQFDTLKDKGDAIVVMVAEDQENPLLRSLLGRLVYAAPANYEPGQTTAWGPFTKIPYYDGLGLREDIERALGKAEKWSFHDAEGNMIKGAKVGLYFSPIEGYGKYKVKIGEYIINDFMTHYIATGVRMRMPRLIISHPDYGRVEMEAYQSKNVDYLDLPLIRKNSDNSIFALYGHILNSEGNPVAGAVVDCKSIKTPAKATIPLGSSGAYVLTDENGYFRYYSTNGRRVPLESTYTLRINSRDNRFKPFRVDVQSGQEVAIEVPDEQEPKGKFHTFSFYYGNKKITDPNELEHITVTISRKGEDDIELKAPQFKSGCIVPNGYRVNALYHKTSSCGPNILDLFKKVTVADQSPEEVIFRIPTRTYTGRVVHAFTNEPMQGVFVMAMENFSKVYNFAMIPDRLWHVLHELPDNPSIEEPALCVLHQMGSVRKLIRTDADGRFEMVVPEGISHSIVYLDENYIGLENKYQSLTPNKNGIFELPTKKMYPAAKVHFKYLGKDTVFLNPKWLIDKENNPDWVTEFMRNHFIYSKQSSVNFRDANDRNIGYIYVPTDVLLKVQLKIKTPKEYADYTFPQEIVLSQGETMDLGGVRFSKKDTKEHICVKVELTDPEGHPVEGVSVCRSLATGGSIDYQVSDKNGACEFKIPLISSGEFLVVRNNNKNHRVETISFQTEGLQDEGTTYSMELSYEKLKLLFGGDEKDN